MRLHCSGSVLTLLVFGGSSSSTVLSCPFSLAYLTYVALRDLETPICTNIITLPCVERIACNEELPLYLMLPWLASALPATD